MGRKLEAFDLIANSDTCAKNGSAGFSLLELVIAVAVLSALAVGASLAAVSRDRTPSDQRVFTQMFERAQMQAIGSRQVQGLLLTSEGLTRFFRQNGEWVSYGTKRAWRDRVSVQGNLRRQGIRGPNVVLLPNGEVSDFNIIFGASSASITRCSAKDVVGLTCQ